MAVNDDSPIVVAKDNKSVTNSELTVESDRVKNRAERVAKLTHVLARGFIAERAKVSLPPDMHGEWVHNDAVSIARKEAIGYEIDTKYAIKKSLHGDGTEKAIIGDVIHMVTTKENYEDICIAQEYELAKRRSKPGENIEERAFIESVLADTGGDIPATFQSKLNKATAHDVTDAIRTATKK